MSNTFTGKNSYSLLKANPKLTGNIKLIVDSTGNLFLESIDADKVLSLNKYKAVKTNEKRKWSSDIYTFFNSGQTPASLIYKLSQNEDFLSIKNEFNQQYYSQYTQGAYTKISKQYKEQLAYFCPAWIESTDIPSAFIVFKIKNPVSINTASLENSYDDSIEKQIYNTDYFTGNTSNYFFETILKDCDIHKVYDMSEKSVLGKYLRNHFLDTNMPESPLTLKYNQNEYSTYNGISLKQSGFGNASENLFNNLFVSDKSITEQDNYITCGFERNSIICANTINFEFLFDDESTNEYEISRYFGFFVNEEILSSFTLNSKEFYTKKQDNFNQNKEVIKPNTINIEDNKSFDLTNGSGVKLFIDTLTDYELNYQDIINSTYFPYIRSAKNDYFSINTNSSWLSKEIVLKTTNSNVLNFKGYTDEPVGVIPAHTSNSQGRAYVELNIKGKLDNVEIRLRNINEYLSTFSKNTTFISDDSLEAGTHIINKFSSAGTIQNNAKALTDCINEYANKNDDFGLSAVNLGEKVVIISRAQNEYANTYKWLIFSDDTQHPPITINFSITNWMSIQDYNTNYRTPSTKFKDYNKLDTINLSNTNSWILEGNFSGGRVNGLTRIKIPIEFGSYFNNSHFLKTTNWYSRIKGVYRYTDDAVIQNRIILNFNDYYKYLMVDIEDNDEIFLSNGGYAYVYDLKPNLVGLFSFYPIKQFDVNQFKSDYGKDGDGYIDKQLEYIKTEKGVVSFPSELLSAIDSFSSSGFSTLISNIDETNNDITKIDNEYNRLSENELPELAIHGRIVPFINKWVFDDDSTDVRENNYRFNTSYGFGFSSFSPTEFNINADPRYYTHEWYYLQKFPPYLTDKERVNTFSYFEEFLEPNDLLNVSIDKFEEYFIQDRVSNSIDIPRRIKYSILSSGNKDSYSSTMFRGSKLILKKRNETTTPLNYNINNIVTFASDYYNGYKFAAVLSNNTNNPLSYTVYENKKFKTITFYIEANLDDYYLTQDLAGRRYLDRSTLYILKDKYVDNMSNIEIADINLSGAFSAFDINQNPTWSISADGSYIIHGFQNSINNSLPSFKTQILPNISGAYNRINISTVRGIIAIDNIVEINKDSIKANIFEFSNNNGLSFSPFNNTYLNIYPTYAQSTSQIPLYFNGGYNAFTGIIQSISFASILDKVNNGDPSIKYISVDIDSKGNQIFTNNEFLIEFIKGDINAKASYLKSEKYISNAIKNNDYKPIGSVMSNLNKTYINPLSRIKGNYSPKTKTCITFNDNHSNRFNDAIRTQLKFKNTQFFSNYPGFALYEQLYINKINTDNPLTVLELSKDSQLKPQWWKISEISLDYLDFYIFRSKWDHNYYRKYVNKNTYTSLPGYVDPKEISSMLASTIMNIPDKLTIEKFTSSNLDNISQSSNVNAEISYQLYANNDIQAKTYKITGKIYTQDKIVNWISPKIIDLFKKYVNTKFNYKNLTTLTDDTNQYVLNNILPRYEIDNILVFAKFVPIGETTIIIENKYTVQELIQLGYVEVKNIIMSGVNSNDYDKTFEYTYPTDKNAILAFAIKIKSN